MNTYKQKSPSVTIRGLDLQEYLDYEKIAQKQGYTMNVVLSTILKHYLPTFKKQMGVE